MGFARLYTAYWPPPYVGYRCSSRAALFTTLYVRPWRGGEAKGMAISLRRSYPDLAWDMVNIIASYMPEKAKSWQTTSKGKVVRIKATDPDPPDEPPQPPQDDDEIQEIL